VLWGMSESVVSDSGRGHWFFFWVGGIGYYINSLYSGGFSDTTTSMCWFGVWWGHGTDVTWTGCARLGSATRHVSFYVSLVG
jgi:hypothetical protein